MLRSGDVKVKILTFRPEGETAPHYRDFTVPYRPQMRILDVLTAIIEEQGQSLTFRWFCGTKKCGGCGMLVNGTPRLACWDEAEAEMTIEPLPGFPPIRDLVVERDSYQTRYLSIKPYVVRSAPPPPFPEPLTHVEMRPVFKLLDCIECNLCVSICPSFGGATKGFVGPQACVQIAKAVFDPRDGLDRVAVLRQQSLFDCMTCHACEEVCPTRIPIVTQAIEPLKRACLVAGGAESRFLSAFVRNIRRNGFIDSKALFVASQGVLGALLDLRRGLRMFLKGKARRHVRATTAVTRDIERLFEAAGEPR